ncbi:MAG: GTPase domain-containing protein [Azonexus sp.]|nr:GTPase domain-containing protein [Betaproteobacteria bacterium]MBP6035688.1 GTPase domain-containing protein [Azonexus sp.]MBP6906932.1 GTPase domain-containing protein [Azonexus sp.]
MEKRYVATLSRSQGRSAWAVIFRHPIRVDPNTGRNGLRVRQGLGTSDDAEANDLKEQLNQLLGDESYWSLPAKAEAEKRFHRRVVEIFYHGMEPEERDFGAIRESIIPLPTSEDSDYRRALLLGTTGAGKTTLLRQLIGTDPETERFPSTSTAKTTVHETEVVLAHGPYKAVVTFFPIDEVREHLNECISEAVLSAYRGDGDGEVLRKLLMHVNQRFRFNYVLGNGPLAAHTDDDDDEDAAAEPTEEAAADDAIDLESSNALLSETLSALHTIAARHGDQLKTELGAIDERDQRVVDELFEEELDRRLREDDEFHRVSDELMDEIELRFSLLADGTVRRNKQGWPQSWSWETDDRATFVKTVTRFSSNHSPRFGRLLTPLVNGVRVSGAFLPAWSGGQQPKLVLLDGEGLGHTPKSVAAISTSLTRRIESTDAIVLVDNAVQPMQAAPVAAMKEMITSGSASKLLLVFTHFDEVKGDNLPNADAKERHVLDSAENVLASIGEELGPFAERALRWRLNEACFFVGGIDEDLDATKKAQKRTIGQLQALLAAIDTIVETPAPVLAKPVYDRMNLVLAVKNAAESFHDAWWPRLGLTCKPGVGKEHWKRIWALSRRLSTPGLSDEYDNLKPVADLRKQIQDRLYILLQNPLRWDPIEPTDDTHKQQVFDGVANTLSAKILDLATRRVRAERMPEWQSAFNQSGRGSSYARASIIGERIYDRAAPIPDVTPSPDRNSFLHEVAAVVEGVCQEMGATLS